MGSAANEFRPVVGPIGAELLPGDGFTGLALDADGKISGTSSQAVHHVLEMPSARSATSGKLLALLPRHRGKVGLEIHGIDYTIWRTMSQHQSVTTAAANAPMSDDALIRLGNLRAMQKTPTELAARTGKTHAYFSDLLRGKKSFGEKAARAIEEAFSLPRGWLDEPHDEDSGYPPEAEAEAETPELGPEMSPEAMEIAIQFDALTDPSQRARAFAGCMAAIVRASDAGQRPAPQLETPSGRPTVSPPVGQKSKHE